MKRLLVILLFVLTSQLNAATLTQWVHDRTSALITARAIQQADQSQTTTRQTDTPAVSGTSLIDDTSSADLFSAAFRLAGISSKDSSGGSPSGTASAYAVVAAIRGVDPLKPSFYNDNHLLRRFSITVGTEKGKTGVDDTKIYQAKLKLFDFRDPNAADNQAALLKNVDTNLVATAAFGQVQRFVFTMSPARAKELLGLSPAETDQMDKFIISPKGSITIPGDMSDAEKTALRDLRTKLVNVDVDWSTRFNQDELGQIDELLLPSATKLAELDLAAQRFIDSVRSKPQLSVAFSEKSPAQGSKSYTAELIYDQGLPNTAMSLTINGTVEIARDANGVQRHVGRGALRGRWEITRGAVAKRGTYLDLIGDAHGRTATDMSTFKVQSKLTLPISGGVDLPISVTWANRVDLISESKVTGHVGFSLDFAKLMELLHAK